MTTKRTKFQVPIYDAVVHVVVAPDLEKEYRRWVPVFGKNEVADCSGFVVESGRCVFGIFFERKSISRNLVAHEVFHLTHSMLDWAGVKLSSQDNREGGALLHGYLMEQVQKHLK